MATNATAAATNGNDTNHDSSFYDLTTDFADLGRERFDHDTAAVGDRDDALRYGAPVQLRQGHVAAGMEAQVFAWNTFQYETEDRNDREELKGDLHGGQLHRQNRAARGELPPPSLERERGRGRGGRGGGRGGRGGRGGILAGEAHHRAGANGMPDALIAGRKPDFEAPPLAKGIAEELSTDMFWNEPIV